MRFSPLHTSYHENSNSLFKKEPDARIIAHRSPRIVCNNPAFRKDAAEHRLENPRITDDDALRSARIQEREGIRSHHPVLRKTEVNLRRNVLRGIRRVLHLNARHERRIASDIRSPHYIDIPLIRRRKPHSSDYNAGEHRCDPRVPALSVRKSAEPFHIRKKRYKRHRFHDWNVSSLHTIGNSACHIHTRYQTQNTRKSLRQGIYARHPPGAA